MTASPERVCLSRGLTAPSALAGLGAVHLLLTSWGIGALPAFLGRARGERAPRTDLSGLRVVHLDDGVHLVASP